MGQKPRRATKSAYETSAATIEPCSCYGRGQMPRLKVDPDDPLLITSPAHSRAHVVAQLKFARQRINIAAKTSPIEVLRAISYARLVIWCADGAVLSKPEFEMYDRLIALYEHLSEDWADLKIEAYRHGAQEAAKAIAKCLKKKEAA